MTNPTIITINKSTDHWECDDCGTIVDVKFTYTTQDRSKEAELEIDNHFGGCSLVYTAYGHTVLNDPDFLYYETYMNHLMILLKCFYGFWDYTEQLEYSPHGTKVIIKQRDEVVFEETDIFTSNDEKFPVILSEFLENRFNVRFEYTGEIK